MLRGLIATVGLAAACVGTAPIAHARSLQDIYRDMAQQNAQQPCQLTTPSNDTCKASIGPKVALTVEVLPFIQDRTPPKDGAANMTLTNANSILDSNSEWVAYNCSQSNAYISKAWRFTECSGESIQSSFDSLTIGIGQILQGG
jgi:hypothetical protein